jgi:hypothetical protein
VGAHIPPSVEGGWQAPACRYGRPAQSPVAENDCPLQSQKVCSGAVHPDDARHVQGTMHPGGPSQICPVAHCELDVHDVAHARCVHVSPSVGLHEQTLQPSPAGQLAPTAQTPPPGSGQPGPEPSAAAIASTPGATSLAASEGPVPTDEEHAASASASAPGRIAEANRMD